MAISIKGSGKPYDLQALQNRPFTPAQSRPTRRRRTHLQPGGRASPRASGTRTGPGLAPTCTYLHQLAEKKFLYEQKPYIVGAGTVRVMTPILPMISHFSADSAFRGCGYPRHPRLNPKPDVSGRNARGGARICPLIIKDLQQLSPDLSEVIRTYPRLRVASPFSK